MSQQQKDALKSFFMLFGTDLTFRVGLPSGTLASKKEDSIFSCNGNKSANLPSFLQGEEMLVIDAPIKVALHQDSKNKVIENLRRSKTYMQKSPSQGLCFNHRAAANKPSYEAVVKAIIESCFVPKAKQHAIHIADFGMKANIEPGSHSCSGNKLFAGMASLRKCGFCVALLQYDIGFTVPIQPKKLIQVSCCDNKKRKFNQTDHKFSMLSKSTKDVYPLHTVPDKLEKNKISGTILLKKNIKDWKDGGRAFKLCKSSLNMEVQADKDYSDTIFNEEEDIEKWELVAELYRKSSGSGDENNCNNHAFSINPNTLYSVKIYSTISHVLMQNRNKFPLHFLDMYHIGKRSFQHLQNLMRYIDVLSKEAFLVVRDHGIGLRVEFSIRPPPDKSGESVRYNAHYSDILAHVYFAIHDLLHSQEYKIKVTEIDPQVIRSKLLILTNQISQYLKVRASLPFNKVYKNPRVTAWLQAHVSLMLITAGLIPDFGLRFLHSWAKDGDRYDPYKQAKTMGFISKNGRVPDDSKMLPLEVECKLKCFLLYKLKFSKNGVDVILDFIRNFKPLHNARYWYQNLPYYDKLKLSMSLLSEIIPHLSNLMAKEKFAMKNIKALEKTFKEIPINEHMEWERGDQWWVLIGSEGNIRNKYGNKIQPTDPICKMIHSLFQLGVFFDSERIMFLHLLAKFILGYHSIKAIQNRAKHLELDPAVHSLLMRHASSEHSHLSNSDLSMICTSLNLGLLQAKREMYIKALCKRYGFPVEGVTFNLSKGNHQSTTIECINSLLNKVMEADMVVELPSKGPKTTYLRNADNISITIMDLSVVMSKDSSKPATEAPPMTQLFVSKDGYEVITSCLNLSDSSQVQSRIRSSLDAFLSKSFFIQDIFLGSDGRRYPTFKGMNCLQELQSSLNFQLLVKGNFSNIIQAFNFLPYVILPVVSLLYETNIMFYDMKSNHTHLYVYHHSKIIVYKVDGVNIIPQIMCLVVSLQTDDCYSWNRIIGGCDTKQKLKYRDIEAINHQSVDKGLFIGRVKTGTSLDKILPGHKIQRCRSNGIIDTLNKILIELKHKHVESDNLLGMIPFIEELSACGRPCAGFSPSIIQNCSYMSLPLHALTVYLKNTNQVELRHHTVCPIFCLKYKISLAVLEYSNRSRVTYFYGFNQALDKVECQKRKGYNILLDRCNIIYISCSSNTFGYYQSNEGHKIYTKSQLEMLQTKYSHMTPVFFQECMTKLTNAHNIIVVDINVLQDHSLRMHVTTAVLHTYITSTLCTPTTLIQKDVAHHALILIFPYNKDIKKWESCILHHPLQEQEEDANTKLKALAPCIEIELYHTEYIKGIVPEDCESGFYMLLYTIISHKSSSMTNFKKAMMKLRTEKNISTKTRDWIHQIMNNERDVDYVPQWIKELVVFEV